jgi:hypothetical protein
MRYLLSVVAIVWLFAHVQSADAVSITIENTGSVPINLVVLDFNVPPFLPPGSPPNLELVSDPTRFVPPRDNGTARFFGSLDTAHPLLPGESLTTFRIDPLTHPGHFDFDFRGGEIASTFAGASLNTLIPHISFLLPFTFDWPVPEGFPLDARLIFQEGGHPAPPDHDHDPISSVPEPTTLLLWGTTMAGLGLARCKRRSQQ